MNPRLAQLKIVTIVAVFLAILGVCASLVFSGQVQAERQVYYQYPELLIVAVSCLAGAVCVLTTAVIFFLKRTLTKIDANQSKLFENQASLARELHILQGEHRGMTARCGDVIIHHGKRNGSADE